MMNILLFPEFLENQLAEECLSYCKAFKALGYTVHLVVDDYNIGNANQINLFDLIITHTKLQENNFDKLSSYDVFVVFPRKELEFIKNIKKGYDIPVVCFFRDARDLNAKLKLGDVFFCLDNETMLEAMKRSSVDPNTIYVFHPENDLIDQSIGKATFSSMVGSFCVPDDKKNFSLWEILEFNKPFNRDIARENLLLLKDVFDEAGIPFYILFGTLLGAVREGNFIAHDEDTDIAVFESYRAKVFCVLPKLEALGMQLARSVEDDRVLSLYRKGEYIDIYFMILKNMGLRKKWYIGYSSIPKNLLLTTTKIPFLDTEFLVPKDYKATLRLAYGKKWHIPVVNYEANPDYYMKLVSFLKKKNKLDAFIRFIKWQKKR